MKKIFLLTLFAFFGQQVFSQMYIVSIYVDNSDSYCAGYEVKMKTTDPSGSTTTTCIPDGHFSHPTQGANGIDAPLGIINQELNSIMSQGYKLIHIISNTEGSIFNNSSGQIETDIIFFLAQPWISSGLEEISTTLNNISVNPNPANSFVDISLDYSIKGKSEVVFINEAGYIIHKESIQGILKNKKYNIDISKLSAGKYLVTILNGKTYTTLQKLIVF
mgnify:CR=1 FL=1